MKTELFNELCASIREAGAILRGKTEPARVTALTRTPSGQPKARSISTNKFRAARGKSLAREVRTLRKSLRLSQTKFAALLGISAGTLKNWEQGHRAPTGPAKVLLAVARRHPEVLLELAA